MIQAMYCCLSKLSGLQRNQLADGLNRNPNTGLIRWMIHKTNEKNIECAAKAKCDLYRNSLDCRLSLSWQMDSALRKVVE